MSRRSMGRRQTGRSDDEYEVHNRRARRAYLWTRRPGATAKVKRRTRRRERHEARDALRREAV